MGGGRPRPGPSREPRNSRCSINFASPPQYISSTSHNKHSTTPGASQSSRTSYRPPQSSIARLICVPHHHTTTLSSPRTSRQSAALLESGVPTQPSTTGCVHTPNSLSILISTYIVAQQLASHPIERVRIALRAIIQSQWHELPQSSFDDISLGASYLLLDVCDN